MAINKRLEIISSVYLLKPHPFGKALNTLNSWGFLLGHRAPL